MSGQSENIKPQIQETLVNISNITCKIKWELNMLKEILKKNGNMAVLVDGANKRLSEIARNKGILSINELQNARNLNNSDFDASHLLNPFSTDLITEALMSIVDGESK